VNGYPAANKKDFGELPAHLKPGLKTHYVRTFDDVKKIAFKA